MSKATSDLEAWSKHMRSRRGKWSLDQIHNGKNGQRLLAYLPDADDHTKGSYLDVTTAGVMTAGTFEGAIPHIGEACFTVLWRKVCPSMDDAKNIVRDRTLLPC